MFVNINIGEYMLEDIKGIGPKTLKLLNNLGIKNINDLLCYYPYRYDILKRSDINNPYGEDNKVYISIYDRENN